MGTHVQPGGTSPAEAEKVLADRPVAPFWILYRCLDSMDVLADARRAQVDGSLRTKDLAWPSFAQLIGSQRSTLWFLINS